MGIKHLRKRAVRAWQVGYSLADRKRPMSWASRFAGNKRWRMCDWLVICLNNVLHCPTVGILILALEQPSKAVAYNLLHQPLVSLTYHSQDHVTFHLPAACSVGRLHLGHTLYDYGTPMKYDMEGTTDTLLDCMASLRLQTRATTCCILANVRDYLLSCQCTGCLFAVYAPKLQADVNELKDMLIFRENKQQCIFTHDEIETVIPSRVCFVMLSIDWLIFVCMCIFFFFSSLYSEHDLHNK